MTQRPLFVGLFLIASATLLLELSLTRLFSVVMYYHFAFLAISVALFGLAASGLYLFFAADRARRFGFERSFTVACLLAAAAILLELVVVLGMPVGASYSSLNLARLTGIWVAAALPFFFAGLGISLMLFFRAQDISRLYLFDLSGAAAGAVMTIPLLDLLGGIDTQLVAATLACGAAVVVSGGACRLRSLAVVCLLLVLGLLAANQSYCFLRVYYLKGRASRDIELERWNAFSHVSVSAPYGENVKSIKIDGDAETLVLRDPLRLIGHRQLREQVSLGFVSTLPLVLLEEGKGQVLVIGAGGGMDVVFALAFGAAAVDAVEINPIIVDDIMREAYASFNGDLYRHPKVNVRVLEGRSYVRRTSKQYDLIQLTLVDSWAATAAGAFSLSENHLYTREAFLDLVSHLKPDGVLAITRWLFTQPRQTLRLATTAYAVAGQLGISEPEKHLVIGAQEIDLLPQAKATFLWKRSPFTVDEVELIRQQLQRAGGRLVYSPFAASDGAFAQLATADRKAFIASYPFEVSPVEDDRPFFFNTLKIDGIGSVISSLRSVVGLEQEARKTDLGMNNLIASGLISACMVALFLVAPLLIAGPGRGLVRTSGGLRSLLYFVAIGLGFILVEIACIQRFVLYLGHPIHAMTVVVASLLVPAGLGSFATRRLDHRSSRGPGRLVLLLVPVVVLAELVMLPVLFDATFSWPFAQRVVLSCLALAPLGFLLGQPFPLELKLVEFRYRQMIPWVWALNGAASVLGSAAAVGIALVAGFKVVLASGACCYLVALLTRGTAVQPARL